LTLNKKISLFLIINFLASIILSLNAQNQKIKELENKRMQLKKEIQQINSLLIDNNKITKTAYGDLENISIKINRNQDLIRITNQQINLLTNQIIKNEDQVVELNIIVEKAKDDYSKMVFNSYKSRLKESKLMFLLSSENFLQALKRTQYMNQYSVNRRNYANSINSNIKEIELINDTIIKNIGKKEDLLNQNQIEKKKLSDEKNKQSNLINGLKRKEKAYRNQIDKKQKLSKQLDVEIDRLIKEAIKESNKNTEENVFRLTPEAKALAKNFLSNKGNLPWPVERGVIIQKFGLQPHPVVRTTKIQSNGIVIATTKNASVRTVFNGTVLSVLKFKSSNLTVLIRHGDYITAYKNLSKVYVEKGQNVNALQIIGNTFDNNEDSKTTLQFSIFKNTTPLDPYLWIAK
jgi:septal ring factor EnvC (AmiA/AmiB activator)